MGHTAGHANQRGTVGGDDLGVEASLAVEHQLAGAFTSARVGSALTVVAPPARVPGWHHARLLAGAGIREEYAAIDSGIDELIPALLSGRVNPIINGSHWLGSATGSAAALVLVDDPAGEHNQ
jgi:hypothetical protein